MTLLAHPLAETTVSHGSTIDRNLVHRASVHEVLLTDTRPNGTDRARFGVQWPRHHVLTGPGAATVVDDTVLLETVRQIGLCAAHVYYDVPMDARFLARGIGFAWCDEPPEFGNRPIDVVADVEIGATRSGRGALTIAVTFVLDGRPVATGTGDMKCAHRDLWTRLRGQPGATSDRVALPPRAVAFDPSLVGRSDPSQVVLDPVAGGGEGRFALRIDPRHPCFFDHPQDHLPANLAAEAVRQAALISSPDHRIASLRVGFERFVELDRPVQITTETSGSGLSVVLWQDQRPAMHGSVTCAPIAHTPIVAA